MRFDAGSRIRIRVDVKTDGDPTGTTVEVRVDNTWYPATWQGSPTSTTTGGRTIYKYTAITIGYFAGPDAVASGAPVLALGSHPLEVRITNGGEIVPRDMADLVVR